MFSNGNDNSGVRVKNIYSDAHNLRDVTMVDGVPLGSVNYKLHFTSPEKPNAGNTLQPSNFTLETYSPKEPYNVLYSGQIDVSYDLDEGSDGSFASVSDEVKVTFHINLVVRHYNHETGEDENKLIDRKIKCVYNAMDSEPNIIINILDKYRITLLIPVITLPPSEDHTYIDSDGVYQYLNIFKFDVNNYRIEVLDYRNNNNVEVNPSLYITTNHINVIEIKEIK